MAGSGKPIRLDEQRPRLAVEVGERDHAIGAADAPVTLLEYGDYECPDCGNAYPIIKRLLAEEGCGCALFFGTFR